MAVTLFASDRQHHLFEFALQSPCCPLLRIEEQITCNLLCYRTATCTDFAALQVDPQGARNTFQINAVCYVKIAVFGGNRRLDERRRNLRQWHGGMSAALRRDNLIQ